MRASAGCAGCADKDEKERAVHGHEEQAAHAHEEMPSDAMEQAAQLQNHLEQKMTRERKEMHCRETISMWE